MSAQHDHQGLMRILPPPAGSAPTDARSEYGSIDFAARADADRPYVVLNMVATADGQARIGEDTDKLGGKVDAALFAALRESVDCILAGTGTIGVEGYNAPARGEDVQQRRTANGLDARPIMATITRSGNLPLQAPLFSDAGIRVVAFGAPATAGADVAAEVIGSAAVDPAEAMRSLRVDFGVRSVLLEGGPGLNAAVFAEGLVDELFLTVAPVLTGSEQAFPIIDGALPTALELELIGVLAADDHLFLRYRVG